MRATAGATARDRETDDEGDDDDADASEPWRRAKANEAKDATRVDGTRGRAQGAQTALFEEGVVVES